MDAFTGLRAAARLLLGEDQLISRLSKGTDFTGMSILGRLVGKIKGGIKAEAMDVGRATIAAALEEAPVLDDLLDGKEVEIVMKVQMRRAGT